MRTENFHGATGAPSPRALQARRIEATGISAPMASAMADIFFPMPRRDDVSTLAAVTATRCTAAGVR